MQIKHPPSGSLVHRHFVAVPLFLCLAIAPLLPHGGDVRAAVSAPQEWSAAADGPFTLQDRLHGVFYRGAQALSGSGDALVLRGGSVLVSGPAVVRVRAGDVTMTGFRGAVHVTLADDILSIAALSTPVLLRHGDFAFALPQGMQGRWSLAALPSAHDPWGVVRELEAALPVPEEFLREQLSRAGAQEAEPVALRRPISLATLLPPIFRFPLDPERSRATLANDATDRFEAFLDAGDDAALGGMLADDTLWQAMAGGTVAQERLLQLLTVAAGKPGAAVRLLSLVDDRDLRILSFLHPELRAAAWLRMGEGMNPEDAQVALLAFPALDLLPQAAPQLTVRHWQAGVAHMLRDEALAFLPPLAHALASFRSAAERRGYPERLRWYAASVTDLAAALDEPPPPLQDMLRPWHGLLLLGEDVSTEPLPPPLPVREAPPASSAASSSSVAPPTAAEATAVEGTVRELLRNAGAAFSTQTAIRARTPSAATIEGILFAGTDGDHVYAFTLDLAAQRISDVRKDGAPYPLSLPVEAFVEWVKGGQ